jgi:hypothetical protein
MINQGHGSILEKSLRLCSNPSSSSKVEIGTTLLFLSLTVLGERKGGKTSRIKGYKVQSRLSCKSLPVLHFEFAGSNIVSLLRS